MPVLSEEQKQFLNDNRAHYETLIRADFLTNIGYQIKEGMLNIARVFDPGYQANLWCGPCVCDLLRYVYTQYDAMPKPVVVEAVPEAPIVKEPAKEDVVIKHETFPKHDEPVKVEPIKETVADKPAKRAYKKRK